MSEFNLNGFQIVEIGELVESSKKIDTGKVFTNLKPLDIIPTPMDVTITGLNKYDKTQDRAIYATIEFYFKNKDDTERRYHENNVTLYVRKGTHICKSEDDLPNESRKDLSIITREFVKACEELNPGMHAYRVLYEIFDNNTEPGFGKVNTLVWS